MLPDLLAALLAHPYFALPHPKSTGRELFSLAWLHTHLNGAENAHDVLRTLLEYSAQSIAQAIGSSAPSARQVYVCGGGIRNQALMARLSALLAPQQAALHSTAELQLDPQWVEAAAFGWLAACWINRTSPAPTTPPARTNPASWAPAITLEPLACQTIRPSETLCFQTAFSPKCSAILYNLRFDSTFKNKPQRWPLARLH